jgi:uncharacterized protein YyaL (SSP411 family)
VAGNRLDREVSPYLLAHKDNPVAWEPWDAEALARARQADKPILLSIGYSACHWCHVMAHESFEDPQTAELINDLFIPIKVDREQRPDLDAIYQAALAELGQQRGWPLTMFLTPDGRPFGGGTYFPPEPRFGRPAFANVLRSMAEAYATDPDGVVAKAARLTEAVASQARGRSGGDISTTQLNHVASQLLDGIDVVYGGFGRNAKFPHSMALELLWRAHRRTGHGPYRDAVVLTAEQMCLGGLYDHLGGGFARYAVDERWLVPHFEKMLYDNALLIDLLTLLWQDTRRPLFEARVAETVAWLLREMTVPGGAFAASLAADSAGHGAVEDGEGAFYVWHEDEIDAVLGADSDIFKTAYDVDGSGNWDGRTILNRLDHPPGEDAVLERRLVEQRARLFAARETRPRPARDDKVLADWNGLMIGALARAGVVFEKPDWIDAARRAFASVCERVVRDGRLLHSAGGSDDQTACSILDDYSHLARAAVQLFEATADPTYIVLAEDWVATVERDYSDAANGGYFLTPSGLASVVVRTKTARETACPSGNGTMVWVLARLHALTGKEAYFRQAERVIEAFSGDVPVHFFAMATLLNAGEDLCSLSQVVIVGDGDDQATRALLRSARAVPAPNRMIFAVAPDDSLPDTHPAAGKTLVGGSATAYVCRAGTCLPPITDPAALTQILAAE